MSPIRKVTFLENARDLGNKSGFKEYFSELMKKHLQHLPHIKSGKEIEDILVDINRDSSSIKGGKCCEKYININLISEITLIDFDEGIEIYDDFDDVEYQDFERKHENMHNKTVVTENLHTDTEGNNRISQEEYQFIKESVIKSDNFKAAKFKKYEYRPKFFKIKFATNYSQKPSDLELVIDEASFNEILR